MGTLLDAQVEIFIPGAPGLSIDRWDFVSRWEFGKEYALSMLLESVRGHVSPESIGTIECLAERVQCFTGPEFLSTAELLERQDVTPYVMALIASVKALSNCRVRVLFWRDQ
jgi:hypothetical protein